jgi:hypothetical protein
MVTKTIWDETARKQQTNRQIIAGLKKEYVANRFNSMTQEQILERIEAVIERWGQMKISLRECCRLINLMNITSLIGFIDKSVPLLIGEKIETRLFYIKKPKGGAL